MRILVSNPDTIGDMMLRQPLLAALADAGHPLMLIVRPSVAELARFIAPAARIVPLPAEVFARQVDTTTAEFSQLLERAKSFAPDRLVIAPHRWTVFEEWLARSLGNVTTVGTGGGLHRGDPYSGNPPKSTLVLDRVAFTGETDGELSKNNALASLLLGRQLTLPEPSISPPDAALVAARTRLESLGMTPGGFCVVCTTGTRHISIKSWPAEKWAMTLRDCVDRLQMRLVFVGLPDESVGVDHVRSLMGDSAHATAVAMSDRGGFGELLAILSLSTGYIGHDTGPMHLAAALGKPVVGVFGGGTWGRFLPAVSPSTAVTTAVGCVGCNWVCPFGESYCITSVTVERVVEAIEKTFSPDARERVVIASPPPAWLEAKMVAEAVRTAESRLRESARLRQREAALRQAFEKASIPEPDEHLNLGEAPRTAGAARPVPLPFRQQAERWLIGSRTARRRKPPATVCISVVVPVDPDQDKQQPTLDSLAIQEHPGLEVVLSPYGTAVMPELASVPRVKVVDKPSRTIADAVIDGLTAASGPIAGFLLPGHRYTPEAIARVAAFFRQHPHAKVLCGHWAVRHDGWVLPDGPVGEVDVMDILKGRDLFHGALFFRLDALRMCGGIDPTLTRAFDWDLAIRLARMFGVHREASTLAIRDGTDEHAERAEQMLRARRKFMRGFGYLGRARCTTLHELNDRANRLASLRVPEFPTLWPPSRLASVSLRAPAGRTDVCPATGRSADRLLTTAPAPDGSAREIWGCSRSGIAVVRRDPASPVWRAIPPDARRALLAEVNATLRDRAVRVLLMGIGDGSLPEGVVHELGTRPLCVDPSEDARRLASAAGFETVAADPDDAATVLGVWRRFDLVLLPFTLETSPDPVRTLARAASLLTSGGSIGVITHNLMGTRFAAASAEAGGTVGEPIAASGLPDGPLPSDLPSPLIDPAVRWLFTRRGLQSAAASAGLEVLRIAPATGFSAVQGYRLGGGSRTPETTDPWLVAVLCPGTGVNR